MAVALGKLTLIIGAGLVGSALSKEGRLSDVTGLFSGACKIVTKHLQQDKDNSQSSGKSQSDSLLTQVNTLRQELQLLASSRSVTVVTTSGSGSGTYGVTVIVVVGVVGYGYIWWKGWKLSDVMFVTRCSFSDACNSIGKKVVGVESSLRSARLLLAAKLDNVDNNVRECLELNNATHSEVLDLHRGLNDVHRDFTFVQQAIRTLETTLGRLEESQEFATNGVYKLCQFAQRLEQGQDIDQTLMLPSSSRPALEIPLTTAITMTGSLPPLSPSSSSSTTSSATETPRVLRPQTTLSASAIKDLQGVSRVIRRSTSVPAPEIPIGIGEQTPRETVPEIPSVEEATSRGLFGLRLPSISILTRSRSSAN